MSTVDVSASYTDPVKSYEASGFYTSMTLNSGSATISSTSSLSSTSEFTGWYTSPTGGQVVILPTTNPSLASNVSGYTDASGKWINTESSVTWKILKRLVLFR